SPAATAAWLGPHPPPPGDPARLHLEQLARRTGGPVPCGLPITVFERAWVLSAFARNELPVRPPTKLLFSLDRALGPHGAAGGAGLPPDADSTSAALFALARAGWFRSAECLREFELDTHFCTWPGEQGMSPSVNAHVLEAMGSLGGHGGTVRKVAGWLRARQHDDGSWSDRWHASPYYATATCVHALHRFDPAASRASIERATSWLCRSQREDGSWGRFTGTAEETGYALQALLTCPPEDGHLSGRPWRMVVEDGRDFLHRHAQQPTEHPALWHDKDLYRPSAIITAELLGVTHRFRTGRQLTSPHENE
ncbi:MAG TPA: prenyltransferase/squalene oxidase repeat-containing protein, partial [Micromonosporaceae bacterium]